MEARHQRINNIIVDYCYYDGKDIYSDGDDVENDLLELFKNDGNVMNMLLNDSRWPVFYQLSPERRNITLPMGIGENDSVLEIGAGMGAVTGGVARVAKHIDCVDISARRSMINAYRNKQYDNITIYPGNFQKMELNRTYDVVTLIGALEYAPMFFHGEDHPDQAMLNKIWKYTKPGGKLYIAIENRLGMKYFSGAAEDHLGKPYIGITGYPAGTVLTYSRSELINLLKKCGWGDLYFYYPYPDYKFPSVIYSDDIPSGSYMPESVDYYVSRIAGFDERRAMLSLSQGEDWKEFANSFLVEAIRQP